MGRICYLFYNRDFDWFVPNFAGDPSVLSDNVGIDKIIIYLDWNDWIENNFKILKLAIALLLITILILFTKYHNKYKCCTMVRVITAYNFEGQKVDTCADPVAFTSAPPNR